jgi:hypothetical protein
LLACLLKLLGKLQIADRVCFGIKEILKNCFAPILDMSFLLRFGTNFVLENKNRGGFHKSWAYWA